MVSSDDMEPRRKPFLNPEEYLLVSQTEPRVEQFLRQEDGISLFKAFAGRDAMMPLPSLG